MQCRRSGETSLWQPQLLSLRVVSAKARVEHTESLLASVDFHRRVDFAHKKAGAYVADGAAHQTQGCAEQRHVAKVEDRLEQPVHPARKHTHQYFELGK
jgi:hypothetical protein